MSNLSQLRKLAKVVSDLLVEGCSADEINPPFEPSLKWVPAENLKSLTELTVNVAPASLTSKRLARAPIERHSFIAVQAADKITTSNQVEFDDRVDELTAMVESIDKWMLARSRAKVTDDGLNEYSLVGTNVVDVLDWDLLEQSRVFHSVLLLDYFNVVN